MLLRAGSTSSDKTAPAASAAPIAGETSAVDAQAQEAGAETDVMAMSGPIMQSAALINEITGRYAFSQQKAREFCVGLAKKIDDVKLMAGISTGASGLGTLAAGTALTTGIMKAGNDKKIGEASEKIAELNAENAALDAKAAGLADIMEGTSRNLAEAQKEYKEKCNSEIPRSGESREKCIELYHAVNTLQRTLNSELSSEEIASLRELIPETPLKNYFSEEKEKRESAQLTVYRIKERIQEDADKEIENIKSKARDYKCYITSYYSADWAGALRHIKEGDVDSSTNCRELKRFDPYFEKMDLYYTQYNTVEKFTSKNSGGIERVRMDDQRQELLESMPGQKAKLDKEKAALLAEKDALGKKSDTLGTVRTVGNFAAGGTSAVSAATSFVGMSQLDDLIKDMNACDSYVREIKEQRFELADEDPADALLPEMDRIIAACSGLNSSNIQDIKGKMMASGIISSVGAGTGIAGGVTSVIAGGKEKKGADPTLSNTKTETGTKGLNLASNILAGVTTATSATSVVLGGVTLAELANNDDTAKACRDAF
jgi:hypothetical protein